MVTLTKTQVAVIIAAITAIAGIFGYTVAPNNPPPTTTTTTTTTSSTTTSTTVAPTTTTTTTTPGGLGTLLFDDEFSGTGLDKTKWTPNWLGAPGAITKPINGAEQSCYDPAQVSVPGDGTLHLDAVQRKCTATNGVTYNFASGIVTTSGKFTFTGGTVSVRMCSPASGNLIANWPAFWSDGTGTWPTTGELDVMEGLSGKAAAHFHSSSTAAGVNAPPAQAGPGCHVYSATWRPGASVTFVYDGVTIGTLASGITSAPMFIIVNLGVGGYGGPIVTPSTLTVDWVRVAPLS